jgi:hypothetical protein
LEEYLEGVDEEIRRIGERNGAEQPVVDYNSTSTYTRNAVTLPTNPRHEFWKVPL